MAKIGTEQIDVSFDDLLLDEENPRLGFVDSQPAALEKLVELNATHFRNLMLSIKENGLDPGDSLYVIEKPDSHDLHVLDGNRRLSAVMVLHNLSLLDGIDITDKTKRSLQKAAEGFDVASFDDIRCVKFPDRASANEWIYRRHTGSADGEGRINWGPLEIARFTNNRSVIDVLAFVGRNADHSEEEWDETKRVIESKQSSNLERILESSAGQEHLGLSLEKGEDGEVIPKVTKDPKFVLGVVEQIIDDLKEGEINSRNMNTASEIQSYFAGLPEPLQPSSAKDVPPVTLAEVDIKTKTSGSGGKGKKKAVKKKRSRKATGKRRTLAPKKHTFAEPSYEKGSLLLKEASGLQLRTYPVSAAFVLRAFLELSIRDYAKAHSIPLTYQKSGKRTEKHLTRLGEEVRSHIVANNISGLTASDLRAFKSRILTKTSNVSIQALNGFVHSRFAIPTEDELRSGWEASIPLFLATFGEA